MNTENRDEFIEDEIDNLASAAIGESMQSAQGGQGSEDSSESGEAGDGSDDQEQETGNEEGSDQTEGDANAGADSSASVDKVVQPEFDANKYLEESSGGLFKSEDDFKASLSKIQEYDVLKTRITELENEKDTLFANDEIKLLNDLHKEGKTSEQIEEFISLRKLGDLSTLDAKEVLVQDLISKGSSRSVAEELVERKYKLNSISLDEDTLTDEELEKNKREIELNKAEMAMDANPLREKLIEKLSSLTKPVDPTQEALAKAAAEKAYKQKLEPFVSKLADDFPSKVEIVEGLRFDVDPEFKESVKSFAQQHFLDTEVNPETVGAFVDIQKAIFLAQNKDKIFKAIQDKTTTEVTEKVKAQFVNNHGLERQGAVLSEESQTMSADDHVNYAMEMAKD